MDDPVRAAEPGRTSPYEVDLCWRGIWSILVYGRAHRATAAVLGVCPAAVCNQWILFSETVEVLDRKHHVETRLDDYGSIFFF